MIDSQRSVQSALQSGYTGRRQVKMEEHKLPAACRDPDQETTTCATCGRPAVVERCWTIRDGRHYIATYTRCKNAIKRQPKKSMLGLSKAPRCPVTTTEEEITP